MLKQSYYYWTVFYMKIKFWKITDHYSISKHSIHDLRTIFAILPPKLLQTCIAMVPLIMSWLMMVLNLTICMLSNVSHDMFVIRWLCFFLSFFFLLAFSLFFCVFYYFFFLFFHFFFFFQSFFFLSFFFIIKFSNEIIPGVPSDCLLV